MEFERPITTMAIWLLICFCILCICSNTQGTSDFKSVDHTDASNFPIILLNSVPSIRLVSKDTDSDSRSPRPNQGSAPSIAQPAVGPISSRRHKSTGHGNSNMFSHSLGMKGQHTRVEKPVLTSHQGRPTTTKARAKESRFSGSHDQSIYRITTPTPSGFRPRMVDDLELHPSKFVSQGLPSSIPRRSRALLRDISPPGMWPSTSDDEEFEVTRRLALLAAHQTPSSSQPASDNRGRKHGRALLRDISPPGMWPSISDDEKFELKRRRALLAADRVPHPAQPEWLSAQRRHSRSLLRDISPPGMWPITSDDDEFELTRRRALLAVHEAPSPGQSELHRQRRKHSRSLLRDVSPPGMWPVGSDDDEFEVTRRRALLAAMEAPSPVQPTSQYQPRKHGRALLRDISPPGMWPITSDDDEFEVTRKRALLSYGGMSSLAQLRTEADHHRHLLRDISPPGMWPITSYDDEFEVTRRRAVLAAAEAPLSAQPESQNQRRRHSRSLLRDISPPGMWPITADDDEFEITRRRALLAVDKVPSPAQLELQNERHRHRRSLLSDISPAGMWPLTSDGEDFVSTRRKEFSTDVRNSSPAQPGIDGDWQRHGRALLRDISPPGMWPTSDDDEFEVTRRRALLADNKHSSAAQESRHGQRHGRSLLRDISPPGMWPSTDDDSDFEFQVPRRRALSVQSKSNTQADI